MKEIEYVPIPYGVFTDPSLSHAAKMAYGRLKLYYGRDGRCHPTHETLAREICISDRQLRAVLVELREAGLIDWQRTRASCVYEVYSDRKKTSDLITPLDRKKTSDLSTPETGEKLPISGPDRRKTATLDHSDWRKTSDPDRKKTSDRKEVIKKQPAACLEAIRQALRKNQISIRDQHLTEMAEIASAVGASAQELTDFIDNTAAQRKARKHPIGHSALMLDVVREGFGTWRDSADSMVQPQRKKATPIFDPAKADAMNLTEEQWKQQA